MIPVGDGLGSGESVGVEDGIRRVGASDREYVGVEEGPVGHGNAVGAGMVGTGDRGGAGVLPPPPP